MIEVILLRKGFFKKDKKTVFLDTETNFNQYDGSVNEKNNQEYEKLMQNSKKNYDNYWDINNPLVRIILIILFIIAFFGSLYYFIMWFR